MKKAIFCKTYTVDFPRVQQLLASWARLNDHIPFLLSVPEAEYDLLWQQVQIPRGVTVVTDESYLIPGAPSKIGWYQQQVCKLCVHRTGFADSYLMLDSDSYLIAPVPEALFGTPDRLPVVASPLYTKFWSGNAALTRLLLQGEDAPPLTARLGRTDDFATRLAAVRAAHRADPAASGRAREIYIRQLFETRTVATQPTQIFHDVVLKGLSALLETQGMNFYDAIRLAPWEYNWYSYYAMSDPALPTVGIRSPVMHFADDAAVDHARDLGLTEATIARHFCAIQMASRHFDALSFGETHQPIPAAALQTPPPPRPAPVENGVLIGRNGRLFLADGPERVLDQHRGLCPMPAAQLALWPELLTARVRAAKAAGAEYALLIAPDAHAIHREDIPELDGTDHRRPVQQILQALGVRPRFCYPLEALRRARTQGEVCHSAGQHWTGFGAYRACRRLLRQLPFALALSERGQVDFVTRAGDGDPETADLGARLDPPRAGRQTDCVIRKPGARRLWQNSVTGMGHMAYWRHWRQDLPRGLLLADGSGRVLQRLLAEAFSELLVVETHGYEAEAVAAFGPDVILSVMAERFMIHPPVEGAAPSALDAARQTDRAARYPLRAELALL